MGHVSVNAAMVYQHRTASRDRAIADSLDAMVAALKAASSRRFGARWGHGDWIAAIFDFSPSH